MGVCPKEATSYVLCREYDHFQVFLSWREVPHKIVGKYRVSKRTGEINHIFDMENNKIILGKRKIYIMVSGFYMLRAFFGMFKRGVCGIELWRSVGIVQKECIEIGPMTILKGGLWIPLRTLEECIPWCACCKREKLKHKNDTRIIWNCVLWR